VKRLEGRRAFVERTGASMEPVDQLFSGFPKVAKTIAAYFGYDRGWGKMRNGRAGPT